LQALQKAIMEPMQELGQAFQNGESYLPELIVGGDAAKLAT
jgi:methanogenic corrinoid protein MtbC1